MLAGACGVLDGAMLAGCALAAMLAGACGVLDGATLAGA